MSIQTYANGKARAIVRLKGIYDAKTFDSRNEADAWEKRRTAEILSLQSRAVADSAPSLTFEQASNEYFNSSMFNKKKEGTQKGEKTKFKSLNSYFKNFLVSHISSFDILAYFDKRAKQPTYFNDNKTVRNLQVSPDTLRLEKSFLSNLYKFLNKYRITTNNPVKSFDFELPNTDSNVGVIETEMLNKLFSTMLKSKNSNIFMNWLLVTYELNMRPGEAAKLPTYAYQHGRNYILIGADNQKNNTPRAAMIPKELENVFERQHALAIEKSSPYLFFSIGRKGEIVPFNYSYYWRKVKQEAQITHKLKPHQLRHTRITELVMYAKLNPYELIQLTGHKSILSVKPYIHLNSVHYVDEVNAVSSRSEKVRLEAWRRDIIKKYNLTPEQASELFKTVE